MFLIIDDMYRVFKSPILSDRTNDLCRKGKLTVINTETMLGLNTYSYEKDSSEKWSNVQDWNEVFCDDDEKVVESTNIDLDSVDLKVGRYYQITSHNNEVSIAYFYYNPDAKRCGFGFNVADGGGWIDVDDMMCKKIKLLIFKK